MRHKVYFQCMRKSVPIERGESVLAAAVRACLRVDYGCTNGNCGLCAARLVTGHIAPIQHCDYRFSAAEERAGRFLMCTNTAVGDLVIATELAPTAAPRSFSARVRALKRLDDNVCALTLQPPRSQRLRFFAGQYARLQAPAAGGGEFSIASCPCDERRLEFHIPQRHHLFSRYVFDRCRSGDVLQVTAPYGEFVFTEDWQRPLVMIAFDIGFAAVKSLTEHIIAQEAEIRLQLYQVNAPGCHYLTNLCRAWDDALDQLEYHAIRMEADIDGHTVAAQHVDEIVGMHRDTLSHADVYCCAPAAARATIAQRVAAHLPAGWRLFYEPIRDRMYA